MDEGAMRVLLGASATASAFTALAQFPFRSLTGLSRFHDLCPAIVNRRQKGAVL